MLCDDDDAPDAVVREKEGTSCMTLRCFSCDIGSYFRGWSSYKKTKITNLGFLQPWAGLETLACAPTLCLRVT